MKIGLVRHFKVDLPRRRLMTSNEFNQYVYDYDRKEVIANEVVIDEEWDKCYCSSLCRAIITARTIYHGEISMTDNLVEIPSAARISTSVRLPYYAWAILNRVSWVRNTITNKEGRKETLRRLNETLDEVLRETDKNILIVSHASALYEIEKILTRKGFKGERFITPKNGRVYEFQN